MSQVEAFFEAARDDVASVIPDGTVVTFDLSGTDGGSWTIARDGVDVSVRRGSEEYADCRLTCTAEDFLDLVSGALESREGFMSGRLRVEGDVGLVLRLEQFVRSRQRAAG